MKSLMNKANWNKSMVAAVAVVLVASAAAAQAGHFGGHGGGGHGGGRSGGMSRGGMSRGGSHVNRGSVGRSAGSSRGSMVKKTGGHSTGHHPGNHRPGRRPDAHRPGNHRPGKGDHANHRPGNRRPGHRDQIRNPSPDGPGSGDQVRNPSPDGPGRPQIGRPGHRPGRPGHGDHGNHRPGRPGHRPGRPDCWRPPFCGHCPDFWCGLPIGVDYGYGGSTTVEVVEVVQTTEVVEPAVEVAQVIDLELLGVELLDAGNAETKVGPTYRVTVRNRSTAAIEQPFDIGLVVTNGPDPSQKSPFATERMDRMDAGEVTDVDIKLPGVVNLMNKNAEGQVEPFTTLFVAVDARQEVTEADENNNTTKVARVEVPAATADAISAN
jgi:hypothetical protein